ncbi:winged helix-turn-helix domain-containing protein [Actinoallomurus bryophytorum]|uniref:DNA-binding transcriptional ArsR family regulator n=1 Tax=Actinoallomurus bryophytorum TaxID=1490222 RepID=A0A543BZC9_9ACTN|nr:winged helix-turn-helix domain-containing protein [Actinoallomurus bryophytorum]TQL90184.1 DNA-binding transcriptional ArsR family regulator [Actinoallomurus bryophytorum]
MLRIHFTADDLARTRIMRGADVMWEIVSSLQLLQNREGAVVFDRWRRQVRGRLGRWVRPLITLAPHAAYFPDFLTPPEGSPSLEHGLDKVLSTPRTRLREDLGILASLRRLPSWTGRLAAGDIETVDVLDSAFRAYHGSVIAPDWALVQASVEADRERRVRSLAVGGCESLLNSFQPLMRWNPPVLEADYPVRQDLVLDGRGLLLVPGYFCWRTPVTLVDPELPPVLVYPIATEARLASEAPAHADDRSLVKLLGRTRAAVLRAVESGGTTTDISRRTDTSVASASQHATVLREAGLISTRRDGGAVRHTLTPLGQAVLTGRSRLP